MTHTTPAGDPSCMARSSRIKVIKENQNLGKKKKKTKQMPRKQKQYRRNLKQHLQNTKSKKKKTSNKYTKKNTPNPPLTPKKQNDKTVFSPSRTWLPQRTPSILGGSLSRGTPKGAWVGVFTPSLLVREIDYLWSQAFSSTQSMGLAQKGGPPMDNRWMGRFLPFYQKVFKQFKVYCSS